MDTELIGLKKREKEYRAKGNEKIANNLLKRIKFLEKKFGQGVTYQTILKQLEQ